MNTNKTILYKDLSYKLIGICYDVYNELGYGYLEKVYENSIAVLLKEQNINFSQQKKIDVTFRNKVVGNYIADLVLNNSIIIELKSVESISKAHVAQVLNYLKSTKLKVGFIINFGKNKLEYRRLIL